MSDIARKKEKELTFNAPEKRESRKKEKAGQCPAANAIRRERERVILLVLPTHRPSVFYYQREWKRMTTNINTESVRCRMLLGNLGAGILHPGMSGNGFLDPGNSN